MGVLMAGPIIDPIVRARVKMCVVRIVWERGWSSA